MGVAGVASLLIFFRGVLFGVYTLRLANILQVKLLRVILKSPMWWFDVTPSGRIVARVTED